MKYQTTLAAMALLFLPIPAQAIWADTSKSSEDSLFLSLDCVPYKHIGKNHEADPVYKITIKVTVNDAEKKMRFWINHHTRGGERYNRFDQYHDQQWTTVNPKNNDGNGDAWLWHAILNTNAKVHMVGIINVGHDGTPWTYEERQYRAGQQSKPLFKMFSTCHSTTE